MSDRGHSLLRPGIRSQTSQNKHWDHRSRMVRFGNAFAKHLMPNDSLQKAHRWLSSSESLKVEDALGMTVILQPSKAWMPLGRLFSTRPELCSVRQRWLRAAAAEAAERRTGAGHPPKARLQTLRG